MQRSSYYSFKQYMKDMYNESLYSIPIDLDFGCPNRDINKNGGCTFCPEDGARAAQTLDAQNIEEQIKKAIDFASYRYKAKYFMLYIQAYTGTFSSVIKQKEIYSKLLKLYPFKAISIGTRPDCLNFATLEYLKELNKQLDVHIDLGVQTLNDKSLEKINRGHDSLCSIKAIKKLKENGIKVFAHLIIGFEEESRKDWTKAVKKLCELKVDGIKIHNLHIIKNTQLHKQYLKKPFKVLNEYEYANELIHLIRNTSSNIPIIRISTDTSKELLEAPIWKMQKGQFFEYINERMLLGDFKQADLIEKLEPMKPLKQNTFKLEDDSITIWDKKYKDYYHPKSGAITQAKELFIKQSELENRLDNKDVNLLDIGFGLGYNSLEAMKINKNKKLYITAIDKNRAILQNSILLQKNKKDKEILSSLYETSFYKDEHNELELIIDDARYALQNLNKKFDIIFLDAFLHTLNPSLLSVEFIKLFKNILNPDGIIITSQNINSLKSAFSLNGFKYEDYNLEKTDIKGLKVSFGESFNEAIPYRDPYLIFREKQIITKK